MQKIFFHKTVSLAYPLKELISISVDESIQYKIEENGMRAFGSIVIHGEYSDGNQKNQFKENIDLDILAPYDKIEDKRDFHVKVEDFDYSIQDGQLKLEIQTHVYGVRDDQDKHIHVNDDVIREEPFIETLIRNEDKSDVDVIDIEEEAPIIDEIIENKTDDDEEEEEMGTYYLYVVQPGDNYTSVSARYKIDEDIVRNYNNNRELNEGSIVIIPYQS